MISPSRAGSYWIPTVNLCPRCSVIISAFVVWLLFISPASADYIVPLDQIGSDTSSGAGGAQAGISSPSQEEVEKTWWILLRESLTPSASMEWPTPCDGAGSSGRADSGGAGPSMGILPPLMLLKLHAIGGRLTRDHEICRPSPFPTGIFRPPRAA
jgi:hypothetical protein